MDRGGIVHWRKRQQRTFLSFSILQKILNSVLRAIRHLHILAPFATSYIPGWWSCGVFFLSTLTYFDCRFSAIFYMPTNVHVCVFCSISVAQLNSTFVGSCFRGEGSSIRHPTRASYPNIKSTSPPNKNVHDSNSNGGINNNSNNVMTINPTSGAFQHHPFPQKNKSRLPTHYNRVS